MNPHLRRPHALSSCCSAVMAGLLLPVAAHAQQAAGTPASSAVTVATAQTIVIQATTVAQAEPATRIDVQAMRPQSELTRQAIEQLAPLTADFGTLANLLPSFVSSAPNGNGFDAAKSMTLRGFPDGQFVLTLDGIPFADPDGFGHHSTSVFPASSIESLLIDRSPGSATGLGHSTLGGSLNIASLALPARAGNLVYGAWGSFATGLAGLRLNTAAAKSDGETGVLANVQHMQSNGAMANNFGCRDDLLLKSETLFSGMKLTLLYSYDDYHFVNPPSVTIDQLAQSGSGVGLLDAPGTPLHNGYAKTDRSADIGYARLRGAFGDGYRFSETLYTYSYDNRGLSVNGDLTLASSWQVGSGFGVAATDVAGRDTANRYRSWGNVLQLERERADGTLRAGLWVEHSHQRSSRNAIDLSTGAYYAANRPAASPLLYDYSSGLDTLQPFAEYEWKVSPALSLKPGLRWQQVRRMLDASVIPTSRPGTGGEIHRTVSTALPSAEGNFALSEATHVYLQWAKGALVPNQSFFYTATPALSNQARPQTSQALQAGLVHAAGGLSASLDVYQVDLKDYVSATTDASHNTVYANAGRVRYQGLEGEMNVALGAGFALMTNASVIRARFRDAAMVSSHQLAGDTIPLVPSHTAVLALQWSGGAWNCNLSTKVIGTEWQGSGGSGDGPDRRVAPYHYVNAGIGRSLDDLLGGRHASLGLQINNLENRTPITDSAGRAAVGSSGPLLVNVLARRNAMLALRVEL